MARAWREPDAETDLIDRLAQTVKRDYADDQHVT